MFKSKPSDPTAPRRSQPFWRTLLAAAAQAFIIYLVVANYAVQAYEIPSGSMEPTLQVGDQVIVSRLSYDLLLAPGELRVGMATLPLPWPRVAAAHLADPDRGDVIVFQNPEGGPIPYIKRVIGLPGETVAVRGGKVLINGQKMQDPWGVHTGGPGFSRDFGPATVPQGQYFVMGDNRDNSHDSRFWHHGKGGFVPRDEIIGRAVLLHWPGKSAPGKARFSRWGLLG